MSLVDRFRQSMVMDYEKWHDGVGYDLDVLGEMSADEQHQAEMMILAKGVSDWRDLEALDLIGTPRAIAAILEARQSTDSELRLRAHRYGPDSDGGEREAAIIVALREGQPFSGYFQATEQAAEYPSPKVIETLLDIAKNEPGTKAYHAAAVLDFLSGHASSPDGMENREFLLQFSAVLSPDRDQAVANLKSRFS